MSELALIECARSGETSVLATVVGTEGSTYRRVGARLVARHTRQRVHILNPDGTHASEPLLVSLDAEEVVFR
jgi:hypothetical protein